MPKLTLVSLSYNHGSFVKQTLESFVNQKTNFDYEIIIADDCSSDDTAAIIKEYAEKYPNLIKPILRDKNVGIIANYLDSFSRVKSKYVAYCECDDYFTDPYKLQKQVDFLESHPECSICFHKTKIFYEDNSQKSIIAPLKKERFDKAILTIDDLLKINFIPSNSVIYRWRFNNEDIYDVFPKDIMPADYYLHLLHAQNGKIGFINETMTAYRKHKNGTWLDTESVYQKHGESYLRFYLRAWENFTNKSQEFYEKYLLAYCDSFLNYVCTNNNIKEGMDINISANTFRDVYYKKLKLIKNLRFKKRLLIILAVIEFITIIILLILIGIYKP